MIRPLLFSLALTVAAPAVAQTPAPAANLPPETTAALDRLFAVTKVDSQFDKLVPQVIELVLRPIAEANPGRADEARRIVADEFAVSFRATKPLFVERIRQIYAARFTAAELDAMTAFWSSPVGRKLNQEQIGIQLEMGRFGQVIGQSVVRDALPRIIDRVRAANLQPPQGT